MTPARLIKAANEGKCIQGFHGGNPNIQKHMPAAFLVSMQFRVVMGILPRITIYKPKHKRIPKWKLPQQP